MKTKIFATLLTLTFLTGCSTVSEQKELLGENGLPDEDKSNSRLEAELVSTVSNSIREIELYEVKNNEFPTELPEVQKKDKEVGTLKVSDDGENYCLSFVQTEIDVTKTYTSSDGELVDGGNCDSFS